MCDGNILKIAEGIWRQTGVMAGFCGKSVVSCDETRYWMLVKGVRVGRKSTSSGRGREFMHSQDLTKTLATV
jgi:hypothetical protein